MMGAAEEMNLGATVTFRFGDGTENAPYTGIQLFLDDVDAIDVRIWTTLEGIRVLDEWQASRDGP